MAEFRDWRRRAAALRDHAVAVEDGERRQVLLVLAEDCDEIAARLAARTSRQASDDHGRKRTMRRAQQA